MPSDYMTETNKTIPFSVCY